jgi:flavin reductase (DIM6/NTAB) family NADH-FMN oxidoreductase RutF
MSAEVLDSQSIREAFRASMRLVASSVSLVTARDVEGKLHGMAVTSAGSLSMDPPSMMVAINRTASIHPVIHLTSAFSLNLMAEQQLDLLDRFSRSDMRDQRFSSDDWTVGPAGQPVLRGALSTHVCEVMASHDFGTHTVFFGNVRAVLLPEASVEPAKPLLWMNGKGASISPPPTTKTGLGRKKTSQRPRGQS